MDPDSSDPPPRPRPRPPSRPAARPSGRPVASGARSPRPRAAPAPERSGLPKLALPLGLGVVLLGAIAWFLLRGKGSEPEAAPKTAAATPANSPTKEPTGDGASPAAAAAAAPAPAPAPVAAPVPVAPPPKPKLDAAAVDAKLAELASAADAVAFGDTVKSETGDAALADRCYAKALALEPENAEAKKRLDVRPFDPGKNLPGYGELATSKAAYRMKAFAALDEKEMSRPERQAALETWNGAKKGFEERVELEGKDPFYDRLDGMLTALRDKAWFKDLDYEIVDSTRPYGLIVQVQGDAAARRKRVETIEKAYRPYLAAYDKKVHDWLVPLSPKPPKVDPTFVTWILLDVANYEKYMVEARSAPPVPGMRAHYEPDTKRAITYSPVVDAGNREFGVGVQALLHELTHAWVDRIASFDGGKSYTIDAIQTHWFNEGIAEYMSCQFMDRDGKIHFQPWRSMRVDEATHKKLRIPMKRALAIRTPGDLETLADDYSKDASTDAKQRFMTQIQLSSGFYADMSLFICWLAHADHGASRERFESYVQDELRGEGDGAFDKRFGTLLDDVDLEKTIDEFARRVASGAEAFDED
jgi:hypothetical protein